MLEEGRDIFIIRIVIKLLFYIASILWSLKYFCFSVLLKEEFL